MTAIRTILLESKSQRIPFLCTHQPLENMEDAAEDGIDSKELMGELLELVSWPLQFWQASSVP